MVDGPRQLRTLVGTHLAALVMVVLLAGCPGGRHSGGKLDVAATKDGNAKVEVSQRAGKIKQFPCMQCHDKVARGIGVPGGVDPLKNKHRHLVMKHFKGMENCYRCHSALNMDHLQLQTAVTVTIDDSAELCRECYALKGKDWDIGAHGKSVGGWQGMRHRLTCVDCHDPHKPQLAPVQAMKGMPFPVSGIPKSEGGH